MYSVSEKRSQPYNTTTLGQLTAVTGFDWSSLIINWLFKDFNPQANLTQNEPIVIFESNFLMNASQIFNDAAQNNKQTLINLIVWSFMKDKMEFLPKAFRDAHMEFNKSKLIYVFE